MVNTLFFRLVGLDTFQVLLFLLCVFSLITNYIMLRKLYACFVKTVHAEGSGQCVRMRGADQRTIRPGRSRREAGAEDGRRSHLHYAGVQR